MHTHLKQIRIESKKTCYDMACLLGLKTRSAYQKKESGAVPFTLREAQVIAKFFKKDISDIFL